MSENRLNENRIEIDNLSVSFSTYLGVVHAVRGVSLTIKPGETLALVGESGSGKTVVCRSIMRLLPKTAAIDSGSILLDGVDTLSLSPREMRGIRGRDVSMIFQDPMTCLNPTMKIGRQIREAITLHARVPRSRAKARALDLLSQVGIDDPERRYHQYPHQFSGGQRQRVVIAIALACGPKVLIADEPTTSLDVTMQSQILDLFGLLKKSTGASILFITHDLGVVANIADRVAVMYAGKIVEIGQADEIFYDPRHPYTWGLLSSIPATSGGGRLTAIPGSPPDMINPPAGDAFSPRNAYALDADDVAEPPLFQVSATHYAATWLLDPRSPEADPPDEIKRRRKLYADRGAFI